MKKKVSTVDTMIMKFLVQWMTSNHLGTQHAIKGQDIVDVVNTQFADYKLRIDVRHVRWYIQMIRREGLAPILAGSNGYYVSFIPEDIYRQMKSMNSRRQEIYDAISGLMQIYNTSRQGVLPLT